MRVYKHTYTRTEDFRFGKITPAIYGVEHVVTLRRDGASLTLTLGVDSPVQYLAILA